jgi:hypothetical protein
MGWSLDVALGKLHRFWWWCVSYAEDGDLSKHPTEAIGEAVGLEGEDVPRFVSAMIQSGWIDEKPHLRVHGWWHYFGRFLQVRYKHTPAKWKRVRRLYGCSKNRSGNSSKKGYENGSNNCETKPNLTKPNLTKETAPTPSWKSILAEYPKLNTPEFQNEWSEWEEYRKKTGHKLNDFTRRKQLKFLQAQPDPIACIDQSIFQGYQGIFPLKGQRPAKKPRYEPEGKSVYQIEKEKAEAKRREQKDRGSPTGGASR